MIVADRPKAQDSPVFIRGEAQSRTKELVPRGFLEILSPDHKPTPFTQGSGRLDLARAIADKANPLTPRVAVNRIWMHHFGEGLVPTPDDLGVQSGKPSNPRTARLPRREVHRIRLEHEEAPQSHHALRRLSAEQRHEPRLRDEGPRQQTALACLHLGVRAGAALIVAAPCCHREVRAHLSAPAVLEPVFRHGILAEREAEVLTDALRALLLEIHGYKAGVIEFISPEHTGKNLMISAQRRTQPRDAEPLRAKFRELIAFHGLAEQRLARLLGEL